MMASKPKPMDSETFASKVGALVRDAVEYQEQMSPDRIRAMEYYHGDMKDMPPRKNWSTAVSRDVRAQMSKAMPSVLRTFFGSDKVVEFRPVGPNDEEGAEQATDYHNQYVLNEAGAFDAIYDGCFDAFLLRNGVLHWFIDEKTSVVGSKHTGLNEMALAEFADDNIEILEQREYPGPEGPMYDIKIKRTVKDRKPRLVAVPLDEFLISSDALCVEDARLVGQTRPVSRSDLVAMGYDKDKVDSLPVAGENLYSEAERYSRRKYDNRTKTPEEQENEKIDYFDLYVKLDFDGDGIAETRHVCMAGALKAENILVNEYASDAPYADLTAERTPHQWEGVSIADDVIEIQRVKTALLRYGLDNVYWQNTRQPIVNADKIENPEALMRPEFGRPIMLKNGALPKDAIAYNEVPFVAAPILQMIEYWDGQASDRTGIDDASAGLPPDALQNVTAKASALMEQKGIARIEMLVRNIAKGGLKKAFRGLLKLSIENQDKARTVRLRDQWVEIDPRSWNADMDATVNTGLGAGTRERDMMVMQGIMTIQEKLLAGFGPDNPFVKPDNVWAAVSGLVEASGLRTPGRYFTKPDEQEVAAMLEAKRTAKPIEIQKIEAQAAADKALKESELPFEVEKARIETEAAAEKERAQSQAAVDEAVAIAKIEAANKADELALKRYEIDEKIKLEREKMNNEIMKAKAASIGKEVAGLNDLASKPAKDAGPQLLELIQRMSEPKKPRKARVVRDENGDMAGIEEYEEDAA